jgi:hypothetical protein
MDEELKQAFKAIHDKLDAHYRHQQEVCQIRHKIVDEHIKDGPLFRDKIVKIGESLRINWVLLLMMIAGATGGFWWLIRTK